MGKPQRGSQTNESSLQITWVQLTGIHTGGAAIDSYNVKWDSGNGTWVNLVG
jgi:hypothetical protein